MDNIFQNIWDRILALIPDKPLSDIDMAIEFDKLAEGTNLNWRSSVVDFLTLLKIDASKENREALALELGVTVGQPGSAERNEALRKAVFNKIALNGGNIPPILSK
jgi:hypothetical protein